MPKRKVSARRKLRRERKDLKEVKDDIVRKIDRGEVKIEALIGRPPIHLPSTDVGKIERMSMLGMRQDQMALIMGWNSGQLRTMINSAKSPIGPAYKRGRAKGEQFVTSALFKLIIAGNIAAIIFYLKAQCNWSDRLQIDATVKHELGDTFKEAVNGAPQWVNKAVTHLSKKKRRTLETKWKRIAQEEAQL